MDWKDLADQLALGEKQWRVFKDGADAATLVWNLERAKAELQVQYDALPGQITQAQQALKDAQMKADQARLDAVQKAATQAQDFQVTQAQRVVDAQAELDTWGVKISTQSKVYENQAKAYQVQMDSLTSTIEGLKAQITSLQGIKAALKSQLSGVA